MRFVASKPRLYGLYRQAVQSSTRPSALLEIDYPWVGLDLDRACYTFGEHVEAKIEEARRDAIAGAGKNKDKAAAGKTAAEEAYYWYVHDKRRRTRTVWSYKHKAPIRITEELRTDSQGVERWHTLSSEADTQYRGKGPGL